MGQILSLVREIAKQQAVSSKQFSNDNSTGRINAKCIPLPIPFQLLAKTYEIMCTQDADDGSSDRRDSQYLTASACVEKLRGFENRISELKLQHRKVMKTAMHYGLTDLTMGATVKFMGFPNTNE